MQLRKLLFISALALLLVPATARAQSWFFTPFVGGNFGGNVTFNDALGDFDDEVENRVDFGATIGWNPSVVGFEFDFGWSPNFFENTIGPGNFEFGDSNVTTFMGNLIVGIPVGGTRGSGVRPYGTVGFGMVRTQVDGAVGFPKIANKDLGFNVGAGVMGFFSDHAGIRGDVRYFRNLSDENSTNTVQFGGFHFWRASFGVVIR